MLATWAVLADERLKHNVTFDLLSEELTHYEQRMRIDRGAEPLRSARLSIYRSSDFAELPRHIATLRPGEMHRVRSAGRVLDVMLKVDVGYHRVGVEPERAPTVAGQVAELRGLRLRGVFTHAGHAYLQETPEAVAAVASHEGKTLALVAEMLRAAGLPVDSEAHVVAPR